MNECQRKSNILHYWRAIEFFSPQKIPKFNPHSKNEPVFKIEENSHVPWDKPSAISTNMLFQHRYIIYGGIYPIVSVRKNMDEVFGKDPETFDERQDGETCLFSIQLTQEGRPLFESFMLSMCGWALGRLQVPGPQQKEWLDGFDGDMNKFKMEFEQSFAVKEDDKAGVEIKSRGFNVGSIITAQDIIDAIVKIQAFLNVKHIAVNTQHFLVKSVMVHEKNIFKTDDSDFLNSFFVKDLDKIAAKIAKNNSISQGLDHYLTEEVPIHDRVDVRKLNYKEKLNALAPNTYPRGCWPTKDFFPLVYAQQFSVNTLMKMLGNQAGIFSINGPPGTGKTTLLRDLIAAVIVERAIKLSALRTPKDAFEGNARWKSDSGERSITTWKEEFYGFEMVVASSNNSAVENVTLEIPMIDAIDANYLNEASYFGDIAAEILGKECWALLAAKLGNKSNRTAFKNKFWAYPESMSMVKKKSKDVPEKPSFYKYLLTCDSAIENWDMAVKKFNAALAEENMLRQHRQFLYEKYKDFIEQEDNFLKREAMIAQLQQDLKELHKNSKTIEEDIDALKKDRERINDQRQQHRQFKPGLIEIIFSWGKAYATWHRQEVTYQQQIVACENEIDERVNKIKFLHTQINKITHELNAVETLKVQYEQNRADIERGKTTLGKYFPDISLLAEAADCELSSPWMDDKWFHARAHVFLAALNLHRAFISVNAPIFLKNLQGAMDLLSGKGQNAAPTTAIYSAWATFFFVVPVISTTFASFDRLFPHYGPEALGWLFIDEAGQATPQAAVGALWRAKRAIVVGDPLQLEPILTIPITAQEALRKHFSVSEIWLPKKCSAQLLSDRVNRYGTYLRNENAENLWIGAPLRVHRRCENPMFTISNNIAYDGMMVFGTPLRAPLSTLESSWFHVEGRRVIGHWIEEEGVLVQQLIEKLLRTGITEEEIVIISPFTTVTHQLRYYFSRTYTGLKIGTIHTMQGKEANVVILVLGGDPSKLGVKLWASEKPNLLNVAVSRAKRRLYVVGNKLSWSAMPYFRELSAFF